MLLHSNGSSGLWVGIPGINVSTLTYISYPASVISVTLGQPAFLEYMGLANAQGKFTGNLLNVEGATSGVFQAGAAVGTIATAIILDRVSRS